MEQVKEQVLATVDIKLMKSFQGFKSLDDAPINFLKEIFEITDNAFLDRDIAEKDERWKQIIPYCVFKHGDKYLIYTRGSKSGEKRLVSKASIGIGGHINPIDSNNVDMDLDGYYRALNREIKEELNIDGEFEEELIGFINDDSTEVGKVHFGIVHMIHVENKNITSNEDNIQDIEWYSLGELGDEIESLESWSKFIVEYLIENV